jgi:hypothetical protein
MPWTAASADLRRLRWRDAGACLAAAMAGACGLAAAAPDPPPVVCGAAGSAARAGTAAEAGVRYLLAGDVTVATPAVPAGWTLARCSADQVAFVHADDAKGFVVTATVSRARVEPWRDERRFADAVRTMFQRATGAGAQHLTTDAVTATRMGGRPCVDIRRSGTASDGRASDPATPDPWVTRELARVCHLQDPAHADAAVLALVKLTGPQDPGILAATAQAFLAGVALPPAP